MGNFEPLLAHPSLPLPFMLLSPYSPPLLKPNSVGAFLATKKKIKYTFSVA